MQSLLEALRLADHVASWVLYVALVVLVVGVVVVIDVTLLSHWQWP